MCLGRFLLQIDTVQLTDCSAAVLVMAIDSSVIFSIEVCPECVKLLLFSPETKSYCIYWTVAKLIRQGRYYVGVVRRYAPPFSTLRIRSIGRLFQNLSDTRTR